MKSKNKLNLSSLELKPKFKTNYIEKSSNLNNMNNQFIGEDTNMNRIYPRQFIESQMFQSQRIKDNNVSGGYANKPINFYNNINSLGGIEDTIGSTSYFLFLI